jgi:hypothetical protein
MGGLDGRHPLILTGQRGRFLSLQLCCCAGDAGVGVREGDGRGARADRVVGRGGNDGAGDGDGARDPGGDADVHRALRGGGETRHG